MGYAHTTKAIQRVKPYLDAMVKSQGTLTWASPEPKKLAYQLHNGLASSEELNFVPYTNLRKKYKIKWTHGKVIAEFLATTVSVEGQLNFDGVVDPFAIVQTVIKHKDIDFALFFPMQEKLSDEDLDLIISWTTANGFIVQTLSNGIRIIREERRGNTQARED